MKYINLTLILLFFSNIGFTQKVRHEGEENNITEEVTNLENRIEALEVAKREFNSAENFMDEYYDLYYKALSSGDTNIANSAIEKLKRANELFSSSQVKWEAYYNENPEEHKFLLKDLEYKDVIRNTKDLLSEERIAQFNTTCCGNDIVEVYLRPNLIVSETSTTKKAENDFWVHGNLGNKTEIINVDGGKFNLNNYEINYFLKISLINVYGGGVWLSFQPSIEIGVFKKNTSLSLKNSVIVLDYNRDFQYDQYFRDDSYPKGKLNVGELYFKISHDEFSLENDYSSYLDKYGKSVYWNKRPTDWSLDQINSKESYKNKMNKNLSTYSYEKIAVKGSPKSISEAADYFWEIIATYLFISKSAEEKKFENFLKQFRPNIDMTNERVINEYNEIYDAIEKGILFNKNDEILNTAISYYNNRGEINNFIAAISRLVQYSFYLENEYKKISH